jgi:hypothetical protein
MHTADPWLTHRQWLFIVLAATGAGLAMIALFILPDYPSSKSGSAMWSMTEEMRLIAQVRIQADRVSTSETKRGVWWGLVSLSPVLALDR